MFKEEVDIHNRIDNISLSLPFTRAMASTGKEVDFERDFSVLWNQPLKAFFNFWMCEPLTENNPSRGMVKMLVFLVFGNTTLLWRQTHLHEEVDKEIYFVLF